MRAGSVAPEQSDQTPLDTHPIGTEDPCFERRVCRLQRHRLPLAAQALQGHFVLVDQCHDDGAAVGHVAPVDDDRVAVEDAGLHHAVAGHFQRIVVTGRKHGRRHVDHGAVIAQRLDRRTCGDPAIQRQFDRFDVVVDLTADERAGEVALDDIGLELRPFRIRALLTASAGFRPFGQSQHFKCPRAVGQAADETALFQAGDQPVDAGLGLETQSILHFIE